ncbi:Protease Do-like 1, chloroplastic [Gracilariopsis chorda]|uniref:Protease Do-like 1, chloroplastic n=1 Tax=Gracilariopsis chorda TaxID=448386 RepID=A0A2V3IN41_9FLOR|nr:Protease Do-like 1, chloroplastic [Gracilariopsis chorda]|eukprot:PXF43504.1 Protease Do-like 1, chloroplastic [Gracilariopsis chorda]
MFDKSKGVTERLAALAAGVILGACSTAAVDHLNILSDNAVQAYVQPPPTSIDKLSDYNPSEMSVISLFEKATKSVAFVTTYTESRSGFSLNPMETPAGTGSGIVWDKQGRIVTNFHVIRAASGAKITLANKKTYDAELVGTSADDDVAVLKIKAPPEELDPINIGSSSNLRVGQMTYAIGNPFGLDHTLTTGVLSGLGREMKSPTGRTISNVIQTEASINPGNSGGPLIDARGRLIGMNTAIYSPSGASAGVGFAIPVDTLDVIANALIENGRIVRPVIGISYLESSQARALGIERGVLVLDVPSGSQAEKAGLRGTSRMTFGSIELGDIIIGIDSDEVKNEGDLFKALDKHKVGDVVSIRVMNNSNEERTLSVKLSASQR